MKSHSTKANHRRDDARWGDLKYRVEMVKKKRDLRQK